MAERVPEPLALGVAAPVAVPVDDAVELFVCVRDHEADWLGVWLGVRDPVPLRVPRCVALRLPLLLGVARALPVPLSEREDVLDGVPERDPEALWEGVGESDGVPEALPLAAWLRDWLGVAEPLGEAVCDGERVGDAESERVPLPVGVALPLGVRDTVPLGVPVG